MTDKRWSPPWHCGFGWAIFGVAAAIGVNHMMNRVFVGDISDIAAAVGGFVIGCFLWGSTWSQWKEFGPDWDGGL